MKCVAIALLISHSFAIEQVDQDLIDEFNDPNMGIAFTMKGMHYWNNSVWSKWGTLVPFQHKNGFLWHVPTSYYSDAQQCVSIVTSKQDMNPYPADGAWGIALHITSGTDFWKYFQVNGHSSHHGPAGSELCAQAYDGYRCALGGSSRVAITGMGKDYSWFTARKNEILSKYNTFYKIHDYNEFDTNGLSGAAVAGVFQNDMKKVSGTPRDTPSDSDLCNVLISAQPWRKSAWPVYGYRWGQLYVKRYLPCGGRWWPFSGNHLRKQTVLV